MNWRAAHWSEGWAWLEPIVVLSGLLAFAAAVSGAVRVRVRRGRRRPLLPAITRRIIALLGFALSVSSTSSFASGRPSVHPGRSDRPFSEAPWRGAGGFSPPHPLVPSGSRPAPVHPAIHPSPEGKAEIPLFERAGQRRARTRAESRRLHPAGGPREVSLKETRVVTVAKGDCLWSLAAEALGTADPGRIDGYWRAIYRVNHRVVGRDPNHLLPGQVLILPRKATG
ncbi:MAG: LysM peptidoglycan-binding domain-containing protein [Actinomycetota bacterium]